MFGLDTLDVGLGMALMFLFVSLIASALREFGESVLKTRASSLERGIREMLDEAATNRKVYRPDAAAGGAGAKLRAAMPAALRAAPRPPAEELAPATYALYNHPLISALYQGTYGATPTSNLPCYIPAANFARAAFDLAGRTDRAATAAALTARDIRDNIARLPGTRLQRVVVNALDVAGDDLALAQKQVEHWFDSAMDRVAGWYKRRTQFWLFALGLGCAALLNIDAINVMQHLSTDRELRKAVALSAAKTLDAQASAHAAGDRSRPPGAPPSLDGARQAVARMGSVGWPIGWSADGGAPDGWDPAAWYARLATLRPAPQYHALAGGTGMLWFATQVGLGWLITAFGVTFGAAFWFDVLNKFMVVRSTVKPAEKSRAEKSKS